ncbi:hypothetical protein LQ226_12880 [Pontibacillus sp. HN14]|nr:hypothetical protein [Pontibacillus sp. HN14]
MLSKILFIISLGALGLYAWTGNRVMDEDMLLTIAIGGFVVSFFIGLLVKVGKFLLTITALLVIGVVAYQMVGPML